HRVVLLVLGHLAREQEVVVGARAVVAAAGGARASARIPSIEQAFALEAAQPAVLTRVPAPRVLDDVLAAAVVVAATSVGRRKCRARGLGPAPAREQTGTVLAGPPGIVAEP